MDERVLYRETSAQPSEDPGNIWREKAKNHYGKRLLVKKMAPRTAKRRVYGLASYVVHALNQGISERLKQVFTVLIVATIGLIAAQFFGIESTPQIPIPLTGWEVPSLDIKKFSEATLNLGSLHITKGMAVLIAPAVDTT